MFENNLAALSRSDSLEGLKTASNLCSENIVGSAVDDLEQGTSFQASPILLDWTQQGGLDQIRPVILFRTRVG